MKRKIKKIFNFLSYCFIFLAAIFTILTINMKGNTKEGMNLFGHQMLVVETESMEANPLVDVDDFEIGSIKKNSMVFVELVDEKDPYKFYENIVVNDVVTFRYMIGNRQETITHRVIERESIEGGFIFTLRGDNINEDGTTSCQIINTTETDSFNYIIGEVKSVSYVLGVIVTILKSDVGLICVIIIPCIILIIGEVIKIVGEVNKDKIKKSKEKEIELDNKTKELEELKRRLLELEQEKKEGSQNEII